MSIQWSGADRGIQEFLIGKGLGGGGGGVGSERPVELNYFSQRRPRVSQPVNAGRHWRGKYCFASEANSS